MPSAPHILSAVPSGYKTVVKSHYRCIIYKNHDDLQVITTTEVVVYKAACLMFVIIWLLQNQTQVCQWNQNVRLLAELLAFSASPNASNV